MTVTYTVGDVREVMATIADGSVDLIATSPPFLALRSYLPADHDQKHAEIGSEANPAAYLDMLLNLTAEWGRVLAPHGSIAIELGDTYSGSKQETRPDVLVGNARHGGLNGQPTLTGFRGGTVDRSGTHWPRAKSLALIPQLYAVALAYGINPLTGATSPAGRWLVRNVVVWARPNPSPGALGDKVRPSTSYIVIATRSPKRWFDLTAVRGEPNQANARPNTPYNTAASMGHEAGPRTIWRGESTGAPPLDTWTDPYDGTHDTWTLTTQPSPLAHYAMWPAKLAERLILMMCPREVCRVCGEPRRRVERMTYTNRQGPRPLGTDGAAWRGSRNADSVGATFGKEPATAHPETLGWTDCGHADYRAGMVADPFAGSGTTLAVADLHGRDAIGIDVDERNADLYPARYHEVKKALYGTPAPQPGQGVLAL